MEKISEYDYAGVFYKTYSTDMSISSALRLFDFDALGIQSINVSDGSDVGLKTFGGEYSIEEFNNLWSQMSFSTDALLFSVSEGNICISNKKILYTTPYANSEIDQYLISRQNTL